MSLILSIKPLAAVLVSAFAVPAIISSGKNPNVRESWTFAAAAVKFLLIASMVPVILSGKEIYFTMAEILPGIPFAFKIDSVGIFFAVVAGFLWIVTSAYSIGYMRTLKEHSQTRYFAFFALSLSATIGAAFSANLFTLYIFYEILSLSTYPLVAHHQDEKSKISSRKYLGFLLFGSIGLVLPAMIWIQMKTGTLDFTVQGIMASGDFSKTEIVVLLLMLVFGFAKSGIMPLHSWLPAAMVAPTPVSALLHAVAVVKVGVFCVVRVVTGVFGVKLLAHLDAGVILAWIASFTIIVSSLIALSQDELKRRLAFSTIGQLSYIVLGVALLTPGGIKGGILHIAMHAFGKITLFFCAGAIFVNTGKKYISQMKGIGRQMPVTLGAFFIGALSVIGLPPCGGFLSKWSLLEGTIQSGNTAFLVVLLVSSVLNAAYFFPIVYNAFFFSGESDFKESIDEAPMFCVVPLVLTAGISVVLFFYPFIFNTLADMFVNSIYGG
ncbi:MAG: monovalent cation/H+ antiporter subunit D family protein [Thermodesulfobacteriota bacterium]